ncbi:MAG: DUF3048 domain-containing protein [Candidatus Daviesbacteria bacterium]|nr:DUF3048 domain-containing protein [Candidatus Daviesbacteria bacterium]
MNFLNDLTTVQKSLVLTLLAVVIFVVSAGGSYSLFSNTSLGQSATSLTSALPGPASVITEDPKEPRTEECPLNGALHTKRAKENWTQRRPLAVMIENHEESRPQSGLSSADIVYEAVAEGGITRFMAVYYCNLGDVQVGPVRSARTYFLDWASEYDPLYAHVGGANTSGPADALGQIIKYGIKSLNQFGIGFPTYWRDYQRLGRAVATEHTMYSTTQKLWAVGEKKGWTAKDLKGVSWNNAFVPWKFKEDAPSKDNNLAQATKIDVDFWQGHTSYSVSWYYDGGCNCYKRDNGGVAHADLNTNQQLSSKNIVVQFQRESRANDGYENNVHLIYKTIGEGSALIFMDGKVTEGKWIKADRTKRTKFVDSKGKEIIFNKGQLWIQTVPEGSKVNY